MRRRLQLSLRGQMTCVQPKPLQHCPNPLISYRIPSLLATCSDRQGNHLRYTNAHEEGQATRPRPGSCHAAQRAHALGLATAQTLAQMEFTSRCLRTWVSKLVTRSRHFVKGLHAPCPCPSVHALFGISHLTFLASQMQGKQFRPPTPTSGSMGLQVIHVLFAFFFKHQLPRFVQEKSSKSLQVPEATLSTSLCKRRRGLGGITYFFTALVGDVLVLALCFLVFFLDQMCSAFALQKGAG